MCWVVVLDSGKDGKVSVRFAFFPALGHSPQNWSCLLFVTIFCAAKLWWYQHVSTSDKRCFVFFLILTGHGYFDADGLATAPGLLTSGSSTSYPKISESIETEYMYPKFPWCGSSCLLLNWCCCNFVGPSLRHIQVIMESSEYVHASTVVGDCWYMICSSLFVSTGIWHIHTRIFQAASTKVP